MYTLICYPACSTCKKAEKFLKEHEITFTTRHIKDEKLNEKEIQDIYKKSGLPLKKLFNVSGQLYRQFNLKEKLPAMSEEEQIALLASDGMLVKRPILMSEKGVLIGYREEDYKKLLSL